MINATHFVLDLETMGNRPTSAIAAIGCVRIESMEITGRFYRVVDLDSSLRVGLTVDGSTIAWWLRQSAEARQAVAEPGARLFEALLDLSEFMGADPDRKPNQRALLWGNGSSFDNVILGNAYDAHHLPRPWMFRNDRDIRTLLAIYPEAKLLQFEGVKHHALADAEHEAKQLLITLKMIAALNADTEEETHA